MSIQDDFKTIMNTSRQKLKYYPFPEDKEKKEYIIGEALLKDKKIPENELATLQNVPNDPPDLVVRIKDCEKLSIEVTEAVPHDRKAIVEAKKLLKRLIERLNRLGTTPRELHRICLH